MTNLSEYIWFLGNPEKMLKKDLVKIVNDMMEGKHLDGMVVMLKKEFDVVKEKAWMYDELCK